VPTPLPAGNIATFTIATPIAVASRDILALLGCAVGHVTHTASRTVPKGLVIGTDPGASTVAAGQAVAITVSSGRSKKQKR